MRSTPEDFWSTRPVPQRQPRMLAHRDMVSFGVVAVLLVQTVNYTAYAISLSRRCGGFPLGDTPRFTSSVGKPCGWNFPEPDLDHDSVGVLNAINSLVQSSTSAR